MGKMGHRVSHTFIYMGGPAKIKTSAAMFRFSVFGTGLFIRCAVGIKKPFGYYLFH